MSAPATAARYTRFRVPHRLQMGLAALQPDEPWLELDAAWADDLREKRRLLAERHGEVFAELPASRTAQREVLELVVDWLAARHPARLRREGRRVELPELAERHDLDALRLAPLDLAGRLVQEDLCVMERDAAAWRLTAASVCFPTRWSLRPKLGQTLTEIHHPVPGYRAALADSADRFFDQMRSGARPTRRLNWSLVDDPVLFQPGGHSRTRPDAAITAANAGERVWLRVERQTLRRLPASDAILFTIRVHRCPLRALEGDPCAARDLAGAVRSMEPELADYKSLPVLRDAALAYLDSVAARDAGRL